MAMKKFLISVVVGIGMVIPAMARAGGHGPKLIHTESVAQVIPGTTTFGPTGPNCDASAGGTSCSFVESSFTTISQTVPLGPSTGTGTSTILYGVNGVFGTPSGAHDASGTPTGFCAPVFSTETDTYGDGSTITQAFQGSSCSAGTDPSAPLGPPSVTHFASIITGGTGKFAGANGGSSGSVTESLGDVSNLDHFEGVLQLP